MAPAAVNSLVGDYELQDLTVTLGTKVTWRNLDPFAHTVTAASGEWDNGNLTGSKTFSFTFDEVGTVQYVCTIHSSMIATISVVEPGAEAGGAAQNGEAMAATDDEDTPYDY